MQVQLIATSQGVSAAAWQNGLLEGVTLPHSCKETALATLCGYVKEKLSEKNICCDLTSLQKDFEKNMVLYFAGKPAGFNVPLNWEKLTPFQQRVLSIVQQIPYGEALSYGEIAELAGCRGGARAVGGAVGANPWLLAIPCHRVLAAKGGLGGFGCGREWKEKLLQMEKIQYKPSGS
ncbi:methylated-DNA--protein-cysteine methyltransferase [Desulforamulus reducens MI-1]|uniref:methylated-DNA--[protein]-cysteine S-methyltransferase n=1 Tax=Desulforamulus reducens (strain ATCC BAA-1160 / DSM 100696 / MI-1) TaxID=349161 RepID=A4J8M4_DESRM|nr:methylated-DNA--[protein]-cysteine S-methyltransferase [Desulforamulus reducens]ABO51427.1 methylated-DNA--protein-cysteine methyltransferase [Desulforamulus reducens MI-1]